VKIKLTRGKETEVDEKDFAYLSQFKWQYGANGYAVRDEYLGKQDGKYRHRTVLMHRVIMKAPIGMDVDHKNRDKLDNRRPNLRLATRSQNKANSVRNKRIYSELPRGVTYNPSPRTKKLYMARLCHQGKSYFLGNFYTPKEASEAYVSKKKVLFGEFA
jgi:hypothetical protein